jgi:hypothetical protein
LIVFVFLGKTFKSGSENEVNSVLNFLRPENPERTMKRAAVPTTMPKAATKAIMLIALLVLFENR